jgi:predicted Zn-dependent protease
LAKGHITSQQLKHDPLMEKYVETSTWVKGRSKPILTGLIALAVLLAAFFGIRAFVNARAERAAEALAEAFRIDQAPVANPLPANVSPAFKSDEEKNKAAYEAFTKVANEHSSYYGDLARYLAAVKQLNFDAGKAEATLRELAGKNSDVSAQARLALAERYEATGRVKEALDELQKLKAAPGDVAPAVVDLSLAEAYEASGDNQKAADLYFDLASQFQGKQSAIGSRALTRLAILAPERVEKLPEPGKNDPSRQLSPEVIRN